MKMKKEEQVQKLAKTLVRSGIAGDYGEALKNARSILKVPEPAQKKEEGPVDPSSLPKLDDIAPAPAAGFDGDASLKDVVEEDAGSIYGENRLSQQRETREREKSAKGLYKSL